MKDKRKNVAQSVRDRLKAAASRLKIDYNLILVRYVLERLLFRLSASRHKDRFALKGAMLFVAWTEDVIRPTRDLDLLGFGESEIEEIRGAFAEILGTQVPDDGVVFDMNALEAEPIRASQLYDGVRGQRPSGPRSIGGEPKSRRNSRRRASRSMVIRYRMDGEDANETMKRGGNRSARAYFLQ